MFIDVDIGIEMWPEVISPSLTRLSVSVSVSASVSVSVSVSVKRKRLGYQPITGSLCLWDVYQIRMSMQWDATYRPFPSARRRVVTAVIATTSTEYLYFCPSTNLTWSSVRRRRHRRHGNRYETRGNQPFSHLTVCICICMCWAEEVRLSAHNR